MELIFAKAFRNVGPIMSLWNPYLKKAMSTLQKNQDSYSSTNSCHLGMCMGQRVIVISHIHSIFCSKSSCKKTFTVTDKGLDNNLIHCEVAIQCRVEPFQRST